jgi:hypothetical protein
VAGVVGREVPPLLGEQRRDGGAVDDEVIAVEDDDELAEGDDAPAPGAAGAG